MSDSVSGKKQDIGAETSRQTRGKSTSDMSVYKSSAEETVRRKSSKESSTYKTSEEYFEYTCAPCSSAGDHVEAHGFCTECEEYLCGTCFKSHSRSKLSRHHTLLDNDHMPRKASKTCDPCKTAGDEVEAAGYCKDCKEYLCEECFRSHARSKLSKHHVLLDTVNMPTEPDSTVLTSFAGMDISRGSAENYNEEYTYIGAINVTSDKKDCSIIGMTLVSDTKLVLADLTNRSLKLIDVEKTAVVGRLDLQFEPHGLTTISQDQVAMVCGDQYQIQIVSVNGGLSALRTLRTSGDCVDVLCIKDKLYVSYCKPIKFEILKMTGAVYKTIMPDSEILRHCALPRHIAVSQDESLIYVSDWKSNKMMSLDMNGNAVSVYPGRLDEPYNVTVSPLGSVYLCNIKQHLVYKMPSDLAEATVILGKGDGLEYPQSMCFNHSKQHLYISSRSTEAKYKNFIKIYKWKY